MAEYGEYDWRRSMISHEIINKESSSQQQSHHPHQKKNNEAKDQANAIQAMRVMLEQSNDCELRTGMQHADDNTLRKFLYARKFDTADTFQLIHNYYWYRKRNPAIFKDFRIDAPDIRKALEHGFPGVLSSKDRKGRCVLTLHATNWDCTYYSLITIYRAILLSLEYLSNDVYIQARGFVVIVDWTEFSFRQTTNLKPSVLRLMIEGLQDCFPARFKGIHFIGQPWYVEAALTVIKPFLKEKIKERIYVHGNNLSTLHDYVHKDILPTEFGGEQPSYNPEGWMKILQDEMGRDGE